MSSNLAEPTWIQGLRRCLPVKSQIVIHGNIHDRVPYWRDQEADGPGSLTYLDLRKFLQQFFREAGYGLVAMYDIVDGLRCDDADDQARLAGIVGPGRAGKARGGRAAPAAADSRAGGGESGCPGASAGAPAAATALGGGDPSADLDLVRRAVANREVPIAVLVEHSSRLLGSPDSLDDVERECFVKLGKCAQEAACVKADSRLLTNLSILICDKLNDLPTWLYLGNPLVGAVEIDLPGDADRQRYFEIDLPAFQKTGSASPPASELVRACVALTQGLRFYDLRSLQALARNEGLTVDTPRDMRRLVDLYRFGVKENPWEDLQERRPQLLQEAPAILRRSVKGQDHAIAAVVDVLKRAVMGLSGVQHAKQGHKPRGILFFAGPTGVGKTELAKALADLLFGDKEACLRFDMSEYSQPHHDQRLMGAPPGYVGYEQGGQLTNRVRRSPFSVLLFDEIDKAHPSILDKFLQILDDGRMTDGRGETVYFSEAVIIFTSNLGTYVKNERPGAAQGNVENIHPLSWKCGNEKCGRLQPVKAAPLSCPDCGCRELSQVDTPYEFVRERVLKAIEQRFKVELGRPEIFNRFGNNFVVFDYIRVETLEEIVRLNLDNVKRDLLERRKVKLAFADKVVQDLVESARAELEMGARGVGNLIETRVVNPLAGHLFDCGPRIPAKIEVLGIETDVSRTGTRYRLRLR